jgi:hypothetical protein
MHSNEGLKISGKVTVRSYEAGTLHLYETLMELGKIDYARQLLAEPIREIRQKNLIVDSSNYGIDILVQYLISGFTGTLNFPLGIAWGELGTGIAPASAPTVATGSSGVLTGAYQYLVTFTDTAGETTAGPASLTVNPSAQEVSLTNIPTGISGTITGRNIYRTKAGGSTFYLLTSISDNTTTTYTDNTPDSSLPSTQPPTTSTAGSISPSAGDTALQTPTNRAAASYAYDSGFDEAIVQFFFPDITLANETYYEAGSFIGGTSSIGSGNMFNHALFVTPYSKSAGTDTTLEVAISIANS